MAIDEYQGQVEISISLEKGDYVFFDWFVKFA